jgi:hypothetical protein
MKGFRFRTTAEIAEEMPADIEWIVRRYVAAQTITDLEGKAKEAGKTTFILSMVKAVADGVPFLDEPTQKTPVVILTEERPRTFRQALERRGLLGRDDIHVLYWHETTGADFRSVVEAAVAQCIMVGARLLVVDTVNQFARFRDEDENHSGPVLQAMAPLQEAASVGLAVLMGRHARKSGGRVGQSGRGSSAFAGAADIVLSLRRPEGNARNTIREIHGLSRFEETPDLLVIELTEAGYVAHGTREDVTGREAESAIRNALPESPAEGVTLDELVDRLPLGANKRTTVQTALQRLANLGDVTRTGRGVKGDPHRFVRSFGQNPDPGAAQ